MLTIGREAILFKLKDLTGAEHDCRLFRISELPLGRSIRYQRVFEKWSKRDGETFTEDDVDTMYDMVACLVSGVDRDILEESVSFDDAVKLIGLATGEEVLPSDPTEPTTPDTSPPSCAGTGV